MTPMRKSRLAQASFRFTARRMVYEGQGVVSRIRKELAELMVENGRRCKDVVWLGS